MTTNLAVKQIREKLHQKWRQLIPTYPEQVTATKMLFFTKNYNCIVDVTIHNNVYYFVLVMEPISTSAIIIRSDVLPNDDVEIAISNVIEERKRRFNAFLALLEKYIANEAVRQNLIQTRNLLEACMLLKSAREDIRSNFQYHCAPDDVIDEYFLKYFADGKRTTVYAFTLFFCEETKKETWIVPVPDLEDSDP
jgi:hypothetical protein